MERQDDERTRVSATYRRHGLVPTWERVWDEGVDITHQPPSTWKWPHSMYVSRQRGESIRQSYLAWYAEALAERSGLL